MITLSAKYGLNPSVDLCFYCMQERGVVLFGRLPQDAEAPRRTCTGHDPCDGCRRFMEQGIILISVDEARTTDRDNPWRTGGWVVIREEALRRVIAPGQLMEEIASKRFAFLPDPVWDMLALPRAPKA